jgi:hypothetical protein
VAAYVFPVYNVTPPESSCRFKVCVSYSLAHKTKKKLSINKHETQLLSLGNYNFSKREWVNLIFIRQPLRTIRPQTRIYCVAERKTDITES